MQNFLPRPALMTISKAFVGAHLDYGDVIYDEVAVKNFTRNLSLFNVMPAYPCWEELGLSSLQCGRWYRKLYLFLKIFKENNQFTFSINTNKNYNTRNTDKITLSY